MDQRVARMACLKESFLYSHSPKLIVLEKPSHCNEDLAMTRIPYGAAHGD